jgi:hypothetical protein
VEALKKKYNPRDSGVMMRGDEYDVADPFLLSCFGYSQLVFFPEQ